jgi:hypothetical protein
MAMKLKELVEVFNHDCIELHDARDGKLVTYTKPGLEKFGDVDVIRAHSQLKCDRNNRYVKPMIYVFGRHADIYNIKSQEDLDKAGI